MVKQPSGQRTTNVWDDQNCLRRVVLPDASVTDQLHTSHDASGVTTFTFDANGNQQIVEAADGSRTTYTWDYENQTTLIELPTGQRVTMAYNADNRRAWKDT